MRTKSTGQLINIRAPFLKRYEKLWESAPEEAEFVRMRGFDFNECICPETLLFVGINPSCDVNTALPSDIDMPNRCAIMKKHPYYKALEEVSTNSGFNGIYSAADVFAIRTPQLDVIKNAIKTIPGFKDFCIEQFKIFKDIVRMTKPRAIVVCNAYAREWFSNQTINPEAYELSVFDEKIGTRRIINDIALNNVPVFFCGMFSGRHQVDKGSRERLEWQIKRAKKNKLL